MNKEEIKKVLAFLFERILGLDVNWRLGGSVNLYVQGLKCEPKDVDIMPDKRSFELLKNELVEYISKAGYKDDLKGDFFVVSVGDFDLEFFVFDDESKGVIYKRKYIEWEGLKLPVLSLEDSIDYYSSTGRCFWVDKVKKYLNS